MVLVDNNFSFRFRFIIPFLPLYFVDDKAKVEQENGVKYHPSLVNISHKMVQINLIERNYRFRWITKMLSVFVSGFIH